MISNNCFKGSTLNVSPLCQGCELVNFANQNDIMFHQCELCRDKYQKMIQSKTNKASILYNVIDNIFSGKKLNDEIKVQLDWDYRAHENPYD